jgi:hypothetical protein
LSLFSVSLIEGSLVGSFEASEIDSGFSISGVSIVSTILDFESSDPGVGSDFFFLGL